MKRIKRPFFQIILCLFLLLLLSACGQSGGLNPKEPVTITLWHNFGGQMQTTMDALVDEFNGSVGRERGVIISVTSVSSSAAMQEKLSMIANGDPGAPEMPDISTCYPATAALLQEKGLLAPLDGQFTQEALAAYLPRFIEEGRLADGRFYVFPFAKSTEVLFVNQTLFDRFSAATGVGLESLSTFEGLARAARLYYEWTDAQTPETPGDGKDFYTADSLFNLFQLGMAQLGADIFEGERLRLESPEFARIWNTLLEPAVRGGYALYEGYSSDLSKTGDIVCSTGSTAGILFYGTEITYADNTREAVEYTILPYPVFEGGERVAIQRGSGMVVAASTPEKEEAAALFLKWFTQPAQNMRFVASTGYLPVTGDAFANSMEQEIEANGNVNIQKLLRTAIQVHAEYDFYIPPVFGGFNELGEDFESDFHTLAADARARYFRLLAEPGTDPDTAWAQASADCLAAFAAGR